MNKFELPFWSRSLTYVFLLLRTFLTVVRVGDAYTSTNDATPRVRAIITLITYANQGGRPNVGVTDNAFAVTCTEQIG